jgi:hypothetical protein
VGARAGVAGGLDCDDLASRKDVESMRHEVARSRRQASQDLDSWQVTVRAELEGLKRSVQGLELSLQQAQQQQGPPAAPLA